VATVAGLLLVLTGSALAGAWQHLEYTRTQLAVERAHDRQRRYEAGTVHALCLVNTTSDLPDHAAKGRQVCEETLDLYHVLDRADWQQDPDWLRLTPEDRQRLAEDTRELLLLLAWSRVQGDPGSPDTLRGALALLDRAEAIEGLEPWPALERDRAIYLAQLGDSEGARRAEEAAGRLQPVSARDHYLLATTYSRSGEYAQAIHELDRATALNPRHYWSWLQKGLCHQELGEHALAAADFGVCIGLWPEFAWGYFNRGYSLMKSGRLAEAEADYTAAIQDDPDFRLAYLNRATTRYALKQYEPALADLTNVAGLGQDDASLHAVRGETLEALGRAQEADDAFQIAFARAVAEGEDVSITVRLQYGFAVQQRLPKQAREAFDEVLRTKPDHPQALYGLGTLLMQNKEGTDALPYFDRAIQANPDFAEARRYRGILLARLGKFEAASQDINWCLEREPRSGEPWYAAACVSALLAKQWAAVQGDPLARVQAQAAVNQALNFLQKALVLGCDRDKAATDPDLDGIRQDPRFKQLLKKQ
jgi:tetratricopeptide (TPR) repeat protein